MMAKIASNVSVKKYWKNIEGWSQGGRSSLLPPKYQKLFFRKQYSRNMSMLVPKCLYFKYDSEPAQHFEVTWLHDS